MSRRTIAVGEILAARLTIWLIRAVAESTCTPISQRFFDLSAWRHYCTTQLVSSAPPGG